MARPVPQTPGKPAVASSERTSAVEPESSPPETSSPGSPDGPYGPDFSLIGVNDFRARSRDSEQHPARSTVPSVTNRATTIHPTASSATSSAPIFGHPTKMMSQAKARAAAAAASESSYSPPNASQPQSQPRAQPQHQSRPQNSSYNHLFIQQKSRPEHHLGPTRITAAGPRNPHPHHPSGPQLPLFSSDSAEAKPAYSGPIFDDYANPGHGSNDFYTDPAKASADLKALLEGGLDEEEEDEPAAPAGVGKPDGNPDGASADAEDTHKVKGRDGADPGNGRIGPNRDGTLPGLTVKLLPHQVEGVEWMRGRELGPVKRGRVPKGGILADDMGLGKTLQTISLILTHQKPGRDDSGYKKHFPGLERTTLVVAPLALIRQWEAELADKVDPTHRLRVCVHHGPGRTRRPRDLAAYDVVITTYQILVSEHGHSSPTDGGKNKDDGDLTGRAIGCFGLNWWRVVLDEAHSIKNRNAKATKACYALRAEYRWCLSGTPMQNSLDELQSLVRFLRISPYDNLADWKDHIERPMKNGKGHVAIRRLHGLLRCFMKRRTKEILKEAGALNPGGKPSVPREGGTEDGGEDGTGADTGTTATDFRVTERKVVSVVAEFSPAERRFYTRLEERADQSLERMMKVRKVNYANALVLLLRLRQACNHPKLLQGKLEKDKDAIGTTAESRKGPDAADADIDSVADMLAGMEIAAKACTICGRILPSADRGRGPARAGNDDGVCDDCSADLAYFNEHESPKAKRPRRKGARTSKVVKETVVAVPAAAGSTRRQRRPRARKVVMDSDEEDEDGSWLVSEGERGSLRLGKAGGEEDENAEGGGDWIGDEDSKHDSEEGEEGASDLKSFIVDDDSDNDVSAGGDGPLRSDDDDDEPPSLAKLRPAGRISSRRVVSDEEEVNDDSDDESADSESTESSGIDESEILSGSDDDHHRGHRSSSSNGGQAYRVLASAKIRELLSILRAEVTEHKFIVFSQFTSMMDLVEPFFRREGLRFTRYDGGMRNDQREASLDRLRNDDQTRILLCSLKCGSLGLNLTAATRVVILEPFWNPFVEEQAIDRVHRLTQKIDVVVYKITIRDTVEERILTLQERKRRLAEEAIEGGMRKGGFRLGVAELMDLFRHEGQAEPQADSTITPREDARAAGPVARRGAPSSGVTRKESEIYGRRW